MSISSFGLRCPAPAPQAAVPHQIVQVVHARKTGSRAQQDCVYVKFLPPIRCGPHAPTSENAALPMSADEAAVVLRSTFAVQACTSAVQACQKTFKIFPLKPPLKLSSARASGLHDMGSSHEKRGHVDRHQGGAATDSFLGHLIKFFLPTHSVHGPSTELGPAGSHPASTLTSPLGLILITKAVFISSLLFVLTSATRVDIHWILMSISTMVKFMAKYFIPDIERCVHITAISPINAVAAHYARSVPSGN
ncbi:hypothetical protein C8J57DRAFT_1242920 [Mycena rebaudengoi]|nr:hypothetical protein C8J57DRAFT_1242920 [Mycena rebaudengoi]